MIVSERSPTDEQRAVIEHASRAAAVVDAGAGTGKTFTIVERVAALVEGGVAPQSILLLTFAKKAAAELRGRVTARLGAVHALPTCSTFHAFAWQILRDAAYDIDLSPDADIIDDTEARGLFRRVFDGFIRSSAATTCGFPLGVRVIDEVREDIFSLRQSLVRDEVTVADFRARALGAAAAFAGTSIRSLRSPYKRPPKGKTHKIEAKIDDAALEREVAEERHRVESAAELVRRFDAELGRLHRLTYDEVLVRATRALRDDPELLDGLRARYGACIVDEYQDTDPNQHSFLETLFGPELRGVIAVGDVNQSIFGFRGAYPRNVERFKAAPDCAIYPLTRNRRSLQEILDLAHELARPSSPDIAHLDAHRGEHGAQIVFPVAIVRGTSGNIDDVRRTEARTVARRIGALLDDGMSAKDIAVLSRTKTNVAVLTHALVARGIPFRLVGGAGFYEAPEVLDVMAWLRLLVDPLDENAVARVAASPAIGLTDAVLARVMRDAQSHALAFARRLLLEPLDALDERDRQAVGRLRSAIGAALASAGEPLNSAMAAAVAASGVERYTGPRAAQVMANVRKLLSLAAAFADDFPGAHAPEFLDYIAELELVEFDEREADVPAGDAVTVSTIHAAKGLEWRAVFLINMWSKGETRHRVVWHRPSGALLCSTNSDGLRSFHYMMVNWSADAEGCVAHNDDRTPALGTRDDDEERRLLYVAVTRARDRLTLSGGRRKPSIGNPLGGVHAFLDECIGWTTSRDWQVENIALDAGDAGDASSWAPPMIPAGLAAEADVIEPVPSRFAVPKLSYTTISAAQECPRRAHYRINLQLPGLAQAALSGDGDAVFPRDDDRGYGALVAAGEYGSLIHRALELWAIDGICEAGEAGRDGPSYVAAAVSESGRVDRASRTRAERAVAAAISGLAGWTPVLAEAPFKLDFGDERRRLVTYGFIDLVARRGAELLLVDYKSGEMGAEKWPLQLALYRKALRDAYGIDVGACAIGRISDDAFDLIATEPAGDDELYRAVIAAADALEAGDTTAHAGPWCATCAYRAAPCMDYLTDMTRSSGPPSTPSSGQYLRPVD